MGPRQGDGKTGFIHSWLEGINTEPPMPTEQKGRPKRGRPQPHTSDRLRSQQPSTSQRQPLPPPPQRHHTLPISISHTAAMGREGLRKRQPKPATPPAEPRPAPKRRRTKAATPSAQMIGQPTPPEPRSVLSSSPSEGQPSESPYITPHSPPSIRLQRNDLYAAEPRVIFTSLALENEDRPTEVKNFIAQLVDRVENAVPDSLRTRLMAQQQDNNPIQQPQPTPADAELWARVRDVANLTAKALKQSGDESQWTGVAMRVLEMTFAQEGALFDIVPIPSVSVSPQSLLPTFSGHPFAFKKVDAAVVLSTSNTEVGPLDEEIVTRHPELHFSQSDDATMARLFQLAAVETKSPDGSYYGASMQMALWLAAGLEKLRLLRVEAAATGDEEAVEDANLLPYPGIVVVGQAWYLHLATKEADGTVVIHGPWMMGDTTNLWGIFRLVAALETIRTWGEDTYYPWLRDRILEPLARETVDSAGSGDAGPSSGVNKRGTGRGRGRGTDRGRGRGNGKGKGRV
ncbi:hypothetical protein FQN50_003181 [Emmonsiellopsis sp. PD_5]|nr:hypothetical protein FQN50_003181 [Emmonsiellopsis sp. PD_5]